MATLQQKLDAAIATENYELAAQLRDMMVSAVGNIIDEPTQSVETLYVDAPGYSRSAPEQFHGKHDTVAEKWEHKGFVKSVDQIVDHIETQFPHEVEKVTLHNPRLNADSRHECLMYGDRELPVPVKDGYVPHTRGHIVNLCEAAREAFNGHVKIACRFNYRSRPGHHISIQPTDEYRRSVFGGDDGDSINPRLIIKSGCGGGSHSASLGWYRDVCNNLTWLKSIAVVSESIRHNSLINDRNDDLVEKFAIVAGGWEKTVEFLAAMDQRQVQVAALLDKLYGKRPEEPGSSQTRYDGRIKKIASIITNERLKLQRPDERLETATAWELFNAVQGYHQHAKPRRANGESLSFLDKAFMSNDDGEVLKAEQLLFATELDSVLVA